MAHKQAVSRILREYEKIQKSKNNHFICEPNPGNMFEWHFLLQNLDDDFQGGIYHGILQLPPDFPMKPPTLKFVTPSGRFEAGKPICLSFTNFHPESWSSAQTIESMLVSIISFMYTNDQTTGGILSSKSQKQQYAKDSINFNLRNPIFMSIFKRHLTSLNLNTDPSVIENQTQTSIVQVLDDDNNNGKLFLIVGVLLILVIYAYIKKLL